MGVYPPSGVSKEVLLVLMHCLPTPISNIPFEKKSVFLRHTAERVGHQRGPEPGQPDAGRGQSGRGRSAAELGGLHRTADEAVEPGADRREIPRQG